MFDRDDRRCALKIRELRLKKKPEGVLYNLVVNSSEDPRRMASKEDDDRCPAGGEPGAKKAKLSETHKLTYGNEVRRA